MRKVIFALIIALAFTGRGQDLKIAKLKYGGGGDWYANKTALPNLIRFTNRQLNTSIATEEDVTAFFLKLATSDKQLVVLPGQAHVGTLGVNRARLFSVLLEFLNRPERIDQADGLI